MFADICNNFQDITKFDLVGYFQEYRDFMLNSYQSVYNYYSGNSETMDVEAMKTLDDLISKSSVLLRQFQTFSTKLANVGFWELQEYCENLRDTLDKITKLPKYCRTSKSCRGYKPYIQINSEIGGMKTVEDLAENLQEDYQDIIMNNDLQESDYEIDQLKSIKGMVDNRSTIVVSSILEQPIGNQIYGKDLARKIEIGSKDLKIVKYEENAEQKCEILLTLSKGDIPEFPNIGVTRQNGRSINTFNYAELMNELENTFLQDELFDSIEMEDLSFENGNALIAVKIKTKYIYETTKNLTL
jgi:hypothetical protein